MTSSRRDWGNWSYIRRFSRSRRVYACTRTPCGPSARAQDFVRFNKPAFVMPYQRSGWPVNADTELTFTMRPLRRAFMPGATLAISAAGASRLTAKISDLCASGIASMGSQCTTPALLTRVSNSPREAIMAESPEICRRSNSTGSPTTSDLNSLSSESTRQPAAAKVRAVANPMPLPAPVIRTVFNFAPVTSNGLIA